MRDIAIYGSQFPEVVKLVKAINRTAPRWRLLGFIDDRPEAAAQTVMGLPVLGGRDCLAGLAARGAAVDDFGTRPRPVGQHGGEDQTAAFAGVGAGAQGRPGGAAVVAALPELRELFVGRGGVVRGEAGGGACRDAQGHGLPGELGR
ncbi:MAG: hypothetical protein JNM07_14785, partial [Phycisphaerae bacterium]|nr:hypothetical protein [Phycisphaerae bacterium]